MTRIEYYLWCFDRSLILEVKTEEVDIITQILDESYDFWIDNEEEVGDSCCEEYMCECLAKIGFCFKWIQN